MLPTPPINAMEKWSEYEKYVLFLWVLWYTMESVNFVSLSRSFPGKSIFKITEEMIDIYTPKN